METQIISKLKNASLADNERSKTSFFKDGPKITRYTVSTSILLKTIFVKAVKKRKTEMGGIFKNFKKYIS